VRSFALGLPQAVEDFPWGEPVVKVEKRDGPGPAPAPAWRRGLVHGPMFLWLGSPDASEPAVAVKLRASYDEAVAVGRAVPTTHSGLGQWGWLTVPLGPSVDRVDVALVCGWVEESYRIVAPRKLVARLDETRSPGASPTGENRPPWGTSSTTPRSRRPAGRGGTPRR
jgi:hypothetical protein